MTRREIVYIDEAKCNGCGLCIPNCAEGALKIINGKAKLISDEFCDGLGACIGNCPQDAINIIKREAVEFNEEAAKKHLSPQRNEDISRKNHETIPCGCPSSVILDLTKKESSKIKSKEGGSELKQWPIQLRLISPQAPYFKNADLLISADCVPFAYADFHREFLEGKVLAMGCPKLDDAEYYTEKLTEILTFNDIKSISLLNMEVPCCFALQQIIEEAIKKSNKIIPLMQTIITTRGGKK